MNPLTRAIVIIALPLSLASCMKENISEQQIAQTVSSNATTPDLSTCKLRRLYHILYDNVQATAVFTYNKAGNPYSVVYSNGGTGVNNYYFYYDTKNRLKELGGRWTGGNNYYTHNALDQIVKDSAVYYDCCGQLSVIDVSTIEYDSQGRIIKETIVNKYNYYGPIAPTRRPTYTYDNRGNLAVAGWKSSSYDNKINPLRQNKVFQFIHRNYSMNNAAPQPKYNSLGLPLSMKPNNDLFFNQLESVKLIYDCL